MGVSGLLLREAGLQKMRRRRKSWAMRMRWRRIAPWTV